MTDTGSPDETNTSDSDDRESTAEISDEETTFLDEIDQQTPSQDPEAGTDTDKLFDEMDVSDVDGEALWDQLAGAEAAAAEFDAVESSDSGTVTADEPIAQESPLGDVQEAIEKEFTVVDQDEDDETGDDRD